MAASAAAAVAKGVISRVKVRGAGAGVLPGTISRQLCSNSGKSCNHEKKTHEDPDVGVCGHETTMFQCKDDMIDRFHQHNMKIIKLKNEVDVTKAELRAVEEVLKLEIVKSQTTVLHSALAVAGVGIISAMVFNWSGMS